jgi:hypothetical protein
VTGGAAARSAGRGNVKHKPMTINMNRFTFFSSFMKCAVMASAEFLFYNIISVDSPERNATGFGEDF